MADDVSKRLKLPNEDAEKINFLVASHMRAHTGRKMRKPTLVKFLRHPNVLDLIKLQHADGENSGHDDKSCMHFYLEKLETLKELITAEPIIRRDCLISGADLIDLGLTPGPQFRTLFDYCQELQDAGLISSREDAIAAVQERLSSETTDPPSVATASDRHRNDGS
jgi:poly(A) polymerase